MDHLGRYSAPENHDSHILTTFAGMEESVAICYPSEYLRRYILGGLMAVHITQVIRWSTCRSDDCCAQSHTSGNCGPGGLLFVAAGGEDLWA